MYSFYSPPLVVESKEVRNFEVENQKKKKNCSKNTGVQNETR